MCWDATWVTLGAMALIALVMLHRIYRTANSHDMQMELAHKQTLELDREETMRLQLLVKAFDPDVQGEMITHRKWWPEPPEPPPAPPPRGSQQ